MLKISVQIAGLIAGLTLAGFAGAEGGSAARYELEKQMPYWQCVDKAQEIADRFKLQAQPATVDGFIYMNDRAGDTIGTTYYRHSTCYIVVK